MSKAEEHKRFTVSLEQADYEALRELGKRQHPALTLQFMIRLAVRAFLDEHEGKQLTLNLDKK